MERDLLSLSGEYLLAALVAPCLARKQECSSRRPRSGPAAAPAFGDEEGRARSAPDTCSGVNAVLGRDG
jgi:hypothetical protein